MITKKINFILKYFLFLFLSLFFINLSLAQDINIQESINLSFKCDLDKKIIKNSEYNYQTFLAKDLNEKGLDKFEIEAIKPEKLFIKGVPDLISFIQNLSKLFSFKSISKKVS